MAAAIFAFLFKINDYDKNNFVFTFPHKVTGFHKLNRYIAKPKHAKTFLGLKNIIFWNLAFVENFQKKVCKC